MVERIGDQPAAGPTVAAPFVVDAVPDERIRAGDWRAVVFASGWLMDELLALENACRTMGDLTTIGPAGQRIRDAFARSPVATGQQAHWDHKANLVISMNTKPDSWIVPKGNKKHLAERYWSQRQGLLLANRVRLNTMRLLAIRSDLPSVGSAFCPVECLDEYNEKALCVWMNSSLGLLGAIGAQTLKTPSYPRFGLNDQKSFPAPDLTLDEISALAYSYHVLEHATLRPFKSMADCRVRAELDQVVAESVGERMGFGLERIVRIREALAAEPSISGQRVALNE